METQIFEHISAIWMLLLPILVPYVTSGIKTIWLKFISRMPRWLGPVKAIIAGWIVAGVSTKIGVPLPSDLTNITDSTTTAILSSGVLIGAVGAWVRDFFHGLKKDNSPDTKIGKAVRVVAGK